MTSHRVLRTLAFIGFVVVVPLHCPAADTETLPLVTDVEFQPLAAQVKRVAQSVDLLGSPLTKAEQETLDRECSAMAAPVHLPLKI